MARSRNDKPKMISKAEAAIILGVTCRTVERLVETGKIKQEIALGKAFFKADEIYLLRDKKWRMTEAERLIQIIEADLEVLKQVKARIDDYISREEQSNKNLGHLEAYG